MKILIKHLLFLLLLSISIQAAITIDQDENINGECPGELISTLNNITTYKDIMATGMVQAGWDIDRFNFQVDTDGLVKLKFSAEKALTIKAGNECNTQTYFRSSNKTFHVQEFQVKSGEMINISLFDWESGAGYGYDLNVEFIPKNTIPTADTTTPIITLLGENPLQLQVGDAFIEPGATAVDFVDGDLSDALIVTNTINTAIAGTYTVTYTVSDLTGNTAQEIRTVIVNESVTPPPPPPPSGSITIDHQESTNAICPGEVITTLDNLTNTRSVSTTGKMQGGWDLSFLNYAFSLY